MTGLLSLVVSSPVSAEVELTLPRAIEVTLANNPDLRALREETAVFEAGRVRAKNLPNPTLDLEGATGALTGSSDESSLSAGINQEFLLAGKRDKRLAVAERDLSAYLFQLKDRERQVRELVETAYYDALLSQRRLALADRSIALNRQLLEVASARLEAGDIPELELYLIRVEAARSEAGRIEVERAALDAGSRLYALMGLPPGESPRPTGTLEAAAAGTKNLAELKRLALESRPDLKAVEAQKGRGDADVVLAQAEAVPNLTAGVTVSREATAMEIGGQQGRDTAYTVGFRLSMPIALFDKNQAGIQEARARRDSAQSRLSAAGKNVEREVDAAYAGVLNADKVLSLYRSNILNQLEENLKLTQEAYRLGEVGILAVIQEQKKFYEVSDGYLTALYARQMALVKLKSAVAADINGGAQ
jgi:cobalt-zinc-cadmium efflux system outer membrane protein